MIPIGTLTPIYKRRTGESSGLKTEPLLTFRRAHRIGQKREVRVLRLISSGTVEELVLARAQRKLEIDGKVIQAGKFDDNTTGAEYEALLVRSYIRNMPFVWLTVPRQRHSKPMTWRTPKRRTSSTMMS